MCRTKLSFLCYWLFVPHAFFKVFFLLPYLFRVFFGFLPLLGSNICLFYRCWCWGVTQPFESSQSEPSSLSELTNQSILGLSDFSAPLCWADCFWMPPELLLWLSRLLISYFEIWSHWEARGFLNAGSLKDEVFHLFTFFLFFLLSLFLKISSSWFFSCYDNLDLSVLTY